MEGSELPATPTRRERFIPDRRESWSNGAWALQWRRVPMGLRFPRLFARIDKERLDQTVGAITKFVAQQCESYRRIHNDFLTISLGHLVTAGRYLLLPSLFNKSQLDVFNRSRVTSFPSCRSLPCSTCTSDLHDSSAIFLSPQCRILPVLFVVNFAAHSQEKD